MSNPAIKSSYDRAVNEPACSIQGVTQKLGIATFFLMITFVMSYTQAMSDLALPTYVMPCAIIAFILGLIIIFAKAANIVTVSIYATLEGCVLGGLTGMMELQHPNIAIQAGLGTMGAFLAMFLCYQSGLLKATPAFRKWLMISALGLILTYLVSFVGSLFGLQLIDLSSSTPMSIGISVIGVCVSSLFLILDFNDIENAVDQEAPKSLEWTLSFGLLLTLIWMYLEILRLLSKR
jgi:uncharacterized YccA/Bax inhibitor family protein